MSAHLDHLGKARTALLVCMFFGGLPVGSLVVRLAEIKAGLGAGDSAYGTAIALGAVGGIIGNYLGARSTHRWGTRKTARMFFPLLFLMNVAHALAPSVGTFTAVTVLSGVSFTLVFVALNSQTVLIEQGLGRSFAPLAHGFWSIGTFLGSLVGSTISPYIEPRGHLLVVGILGILGFSYGTRGLLPSEMDDRPHDDPTQLPRHERIPRHALQFLVLVAVGQWLGLFAEVSIGDWSSVLFRENFGIAIGPNGYGFTAFVLVQIVGRLGSPRLIDAYGMRRVVSVMGFIGAAGFIACIFAANLVHTSSTTGALWLGCAAYAFMGLGVASLPPSFVMAAGRIPGLPSARALALTGYITASLNLFARVGFSHVVEWISLPHAVIITGIALALSASMSFVLDPAKAEQHAIRR